MCSFHHKHLAVDLRNHSWENIDFEICHGALQLPYSDIQAYFLLTCPHIVYGKHVHVHVALKYVCYVWHTLEPPQYVISGMCLVQLISVT